MIKPIIFILLIAVLCCAVTAKRHGHSGGKKESDDGLVAPCDNGKTFTKKQRDAQDKSLAECHLKRNDTISIFLTKGFDLNNDGAFSIEECEEARNYYLNWLEKTVLETCKTIFMKCDCDSDGRIDVDDFENARRTCLPDCNAITMIDKAVGSKMDGNAFEGIKEK